MILIASNNAQTTLAGGISNVATTANLQSGSGSLFPNPTPTEEYFVGTFVDAATGLLNEIVWVTQRTGDTITMERGQEGTTQRSWSPNDLFGNLMTAGQLETMVQKGELQGQEGNYAVDTGSVNAISCTLNPELITPIDGMPIRVLIANTNTSTVTFNPGTGAADVVNPDGSVLSAGQVIGDGIFTFYWNNFYGKWQLGDMVSPSDIPPGLMLPDGGVAGAPSGWYDMYGQALSRTTDSRLFARLTRSSTVTISIATPGVVTWASHGLENGSKVSFETTGALPSGLAPGTDYYVVNKATSTFQVAATVGGAAINTTGTQSGTQTCRFNPWGCGNGTTTFTIPDGRGRAFFGADNIGGSFATVLGNGATGGITGPAIIGAVGGQQEHTQTGAEVGPHSHTFAQALLSTTGSILNGSQTGNTGNLYNNAGTDASPAAAPMNVTPPAFIGNWIIKR